MADRGRPLPLEFVLSAARADQLPPAEREVAVVGRSNVGKSSLLNALANRKSLARTSKTPGATRLLNVYGLGNGPPGRWLVDLPGYGYAKVPDHERVRWQRMIEGYLTTRSTLDSVLLLIDGAVGPTALDLQTVEWLDHVGLDIRYVATKADKVKASKREARRRDLTGELGVEPATVTWVSATDGRGLAELRAELHRVLTAG